MVNGDLREWDLSGGFEVPCEPPYGDHYYVRGYMMYDTERLYIATHVGDPRPLRNSIFPESEQAVSDVCWKGGSVQVWLSYRSPAGLARGSVLLTLLAATE